ncbi:trypsin-like serine protease [Leucobacter manosquensis]|uniref:Trypsin-like serine protease n=1 Tax=Leucobacter manosquensis TaxID=2810611 RepID=A0ABS5M4S1_9MICO|nr:trypsin-like serine protease [Leucobacter manosquensis]
MTQRRPLALGAAAVLGFGSLFIAAPAMAEETPTVDTTASAMAAVTEINKEVAEAPAVGAGTTTDGQPIVMVEEVTAKNADQIEALAAEHGVSNVAIVGNVVSHASTDIVAGAGYFGELSDDRVGTCSTGFTGFTPEGEPALITAGHCSSDGAVTDVQFSDPSNDAAGGEFIEPDGNGIAGSFAFSQFGGVGNTPGAENDPNSTDIAVIDITNDALNLLPEVTDWTTAAQDDLSLSTTPIKSVGLPQSGTISKSGRTTGLSTGNTTVNLRYSDGSIRATEILDGYMQVSNRWVHGFIGGATTSPGDSGGAVFQGETAVGVVSGGPDEVPAGTDDYAWYTLLQPALGFTDGYTVALDIDEPVVKTDVSNGVAGGSDIVVTVPSNAKELSVGQGQSGEVIPVEGTEVSFPAPQEPGQYTRTLTATNGFSKSESVEVNFEVVLAAPGVDDITSEESDVTLTGTGVPGAELDITVTREGADPVSLTATVKEDGTWSVATELEYGNYTVSATQTFEGQTSDAGTGTVAVVPAAPAITSVEPGATFEAADAPSAISGTGIEGATVIVKLNGEEVGTATAGGAASESGVSAEAAVVGADGTWTIDLGAQLGAGAYTVEATQAINGATSSATSLVFNVAAAPVAPVDPGTPGAPADPSNPVAPGGQGGTGGAELVNTGTGFSMLPFGLAALGMLILGGGAIVFTQRRLQATAAE